MSILISVRNSFIAFITGFVGLSLLLLAGCSGGNPQTTDGPEVLQPETTLPFSMPEFPIGENDMRQGTVVDSDSVPGAAFIEGFGATVDGTAAMIKARTTPADITAFAVYQHSPRPNPFVPYMISVNGYYQDVDPADEDPTEGYYVLYADYNLGRWVISGLTKTVTTRIEIPGTANVVSPGGFIYIAVVAYNGNTVRVTNVKVGYDSGLGYEQYVLPVVPGMSVGELCDIELDEAGNPQIAYFTSPNLAEAINRRVRIASLVGDEWQIQDIATVPDAEFFDFALGSAGRRALIVFDSRGDQFLMFDPGTGTFNTEYDSLLELPADKPRTSTRPAITFINSLDDPLGELDTAFSLYAINNGLDINVMYLRADGLLPTAPGAFGGVPTQRVGDLGLTTFSDNMARSSVLTPVGLTSSCVFGTYSAVADSWGPSGIGVWSGLNPGSGSDRSGVQIRELPTNDVVAAYRSGDEAAYVFGIWDSVTWTSNENDHVSCNVAPSERAIDIEHNSSGRTFFPTVYGSFSPVVYFSTIGNLFPFDPVYLSNEPVSCSDISMAVDAADTLHLAWQRPLDAQLVYFTMDTLGATTEEVVDNGADGTAIGFGPAPIVADGDVLHIFHLDQAHGQIVYSRNNAGVWETEQEPVLPIEGLPYILIQAGLLENTGQVYVGYLDYFDFVWRVLVSDANQENWHVEDISPFIFEYMLIADDESSIVAANHQAIFDSEDIGLYLIKGMGQSGSKTSELIALDQDLITPPVALAYSQFNSSWYLATNSNSRQQGYLFHQVAPGTWQGPYTIDQQTTGVDGRLEVFGLACRDIDGQVSAMVSEINHGTTVRQFSSLVSDPETISFGSKTLITSFDKLLFESNWEASAAVDQDGELALRLVRQLAGDPLQDVLMFTDNDGTWSFEFWNSPVYDHTVWLSTGFAVMEGDMPVATLVEDDNTVPLFGRVFVYYPW